ncbi:aldehyde dehydrogenase family protein [Pontivivens ytuae]|uniref:Aldehyde dehydrogenase family protein n=1 Tax=Pontivivens ytuae TaxID=2789856 RepID=A0A7S9LQG5_9RHOB|nr:aldehyde dehydrogenase family protein [Pontivivens ytuae]QPH53352.1 aldehyde dehydrogenase family protein [Pontivivens ytuae]
MSGVDAIPTGCFVGGTFVDGGQGFEVLDKFHLTPAARVSAADAATISRALDLAAAYQPASGAERAALLHRVRDRVAERRDAFRDAMVVEAGFPMRDAAGEIARALETLKLSAEEAGRLTGEMVPFDGAPGGAGRIGFTLRKPVGIVVAITPFNAPLNTVCHKIGPAVAAGNAVILKPSDRTPLTANLLAECFAEAGAPDGVLAVLHGGADVAGLLLDDPRPGFYAFTGSTQAGRAIQARAGLRRTQMELGSIAGTIVLADADIGEAAAKCAGASFRKAGQVCTSIQLLLVEKRALPEFGDAYLSHVETLVAGDPAREETDVGPVISPEAADRIAALLEGQTLLTGGERDRSVIEPTVIADPDPLSAAATREIFGPVVCLIGVDSLDEAIARVNATPYGLATGLFTRDLGAAFRAADQLHVGGVHVGETSSSRVDLMPYGGVKASGFGHEGPARAVREMSEERLVTFTGFAS